MCSAHLAAVDVMGQAVAITEHGHCLYTGNCGLLVHDEMLATLNVHIDVRMYIRRWFSRDKGHSKPGVPGWQ